MLFRLAWCSRACAKKVAWVGSDGWMDQLGGWAVLWVAGKCHWGGVYLDPDAARVAAKRLAAGRE